MLVKENQEPELKANGAKFNVVRTRLRTVLVKHTKMEAPDVGDVEEVDAK